MTDQIRIFDTTLRDGEQSPGCSMNLEEKLRVAAQLEALGVDIIEAGFAIASDGDFAASARSRGSANAPPSPASPAPPPVTSNAPGPPYAARGAPRIHTFIATSPLHMRVKLNMSPEAVLEAIPRSVGHARALCPDVEW